MRTSARCSRVYFFFQAEDGIRDLVRSRGPGDVYKRQEQSLVLIDRQQRAVGERPAPRREIETDNPEFGDERIRHRQVRFSSRAVSYTHLTLPTSDLV